MLANQESVLSTGNFLRRFLIVLGIVLSFGGFSAALAYRFRSPVPLTQEEVRGLTEFIGQQSSEPIQGITPQRHGCVAVAMGQPHCCGGIFYVKKAGDSWQIVARTIGVE